MCRGKGGIKTPDILQNRAVDPSQVAVICYFTIFPWKEVNELGKQKEKVESLASTLNNSELTSPIFNFFTHNLRVLIATSLGYSSSYSWLSTFYELVTVSRALQAKLILTALQEIYYCHPVLQMRIQRHKENYLLS